jgi:dienelactone hydrolase
MENVTFFDHDTELEATYFLPEKEGISPLVFVFHAWAGKDEFALQKAEEISAWGYTTFAVDLYGKGVLGKTPKECAELKKPFLIDHNLLERRIRKNLENAISDPHQKFAAIGFGFGGWAALQLATFEPTIKGVASIYGHVNIENVEKIKSKILILHGFQLHLFSDTMHAFMNPKIDLPEMGLKYQPRSAKRAWQQVNLFLKELFEEE